MLENDAGRVWVYDKLVHHPPQGYMRVACTSGTCAQCNCAVKAPRFNSIHCTWHDSYPLPVGYKYTYLTGNRKRDYPSTAPQNPFVQ